MNASDGLPVVTRPPDLLPLAELPSLTLVDERQDVRGWSIRASDGRPLGLVTDLLADPDRLTSEFLLVREPDGAHQVVPLSALEALQHKALIAGSGLPPIQLRYVSTVRLTVWAAAGAALLVGIWLLSGC